jgi:hypothetical protein
MNRKASTNFVGGRTAAAGGTVPQKASLPYNAAHFYKN